MTADISIVIPTVARRSLLRAVRSIFEQRFDGSIQILIGVDIDLYGQYRVLRDTLDASCPPHVSILWLDPGYSTSRRHGGIHTNQFGGSLQTALSFLAQSRHVMYLDDDDWLAQPHCREILAAIGDKPWAFAYSLYADGDTGQALAIDRLESVGVGHGCHAKRFGGYVRPSGLLLDKIQLGSMMHLWAESPFSTGNASDRVIFDRLKTLPHGCTGRATVFYALDPKDGMHDLRMKFIQQATGRQAPPIMSKTESLR